MAAMAAMFYIHASWTGDRSRTFTDLIRIYCDGLTGYRRSIDGSTSRISPSSRRAHSTTVSPPLALLSSSPVCVSSPLPRRASADPTACTVYTSASRKSLDTADLVSALGYKMFATINITAMATFFLHLLCTLHTVRAFGPYSILGIADIEGQRVRCSPHGDAASIVRAQRSQREYLGTMGRQRGGSL